MATGLGLSARTKSFESPVSALDEDLLDRRRLAEDIYTVVKGTPPGWSCRVGVYGKWGEGKTSVLRFVETLAQQEDVTTFWINPSRAEDANDLWRIIMDEFVNALYRADLLTGDVKEWRLRSLADKTKPFDPLLETNRNLKAFAKFGREALKTWLLPSGEQIAHIRGKLHSKTILVFIDDLDRTDPRLVPMLLLALRDVLDLPGFSFVVAFDNEIVEGMLKQVSTAWGNGGDFLDKILDFSFTLPKIADESRMALLTRDIGNFCPWMDLAVIRGNADALPTTPRKIKALVRNLITLAPFMARHNSTEVVWVDLLYGQLLRTESPAFLTDFLEKSIDGIVQLPSPYAPKGAPSQEKRVGDMLAQCRGVSDTTMARIESLVNLWISRRGYSRTNMAHYAGFGSIHRDITNREFDDLVAQAGPVPEVAAIEEGLRAHAILVRRPLPDIARAFLRMLLESRDALLASAADAELEEISANCIERANQLLHLLASILGRGYAEFCGDASRAATILPFLVGQAFKWIGFNHSANALARNAETELLVTLAGGNSRVTGLEWLAALRLDAPTHLLPDALAPAFELHTKLFDMVKGRIVTEGCRLFQSEKLDGLRPSEAAQACFLSFKSPIWCPEGLEHFQVTLQTAQENDLVRENAHELLQCVSWSHAGPGFSGNLEEYQRIMMLPNLAAALWRATTSRQLQYRFQHQLVKLRDTMIMKGVPPDELPVPDWLQTRVRELSPSNGAMNPPD